MTFEVIHHFLEFREPFAIAHGTRTGTDVVLLKLNYEGQTGWGEASLPPYLKHHKDRIAEVVSEAVTALQQLPFQYDRQYKLIRSITADYLPAMACVDTALCSLHAQRSKQPLWQWLGINDPTTPLCAFTIGMGVKEQIRRKVAAASQFPYLKFKMGGPMDGDILDYLVNEHKGDFSVDANQGWKSVGEALEKIQLLEKSDGNCLFVEQPLPKDLHSESGELSRSTSMELFADESVQTVHDIDKVAGIFDGINIKLMKCGGISAGLEMVRKGREAGLKILIGSMSETSCGIMAAASLSPLADYADLDGPLLTTNNPFPMPEYREGRIVLEN